MSWLSKGEAQANAKKVSEHRITDQRIMGYWVDGVFHQTTDQRRTRVVVVTRYPAMTKAAAEDLVNDWDAVPNAEAVMQERNPLDCYDVVVTQTTEGAWTNV